MNNFSRLSAFFDKGDSFYDSLLASPFEKDVYSERYEFATKGSIFFLLE